jgi:hypothetical protein
MPLQVVCCCGVAHGAAQPGEEVAHDVRAPAGLREKREAGPDSYVTIKLSFSWLACVCWFWLKFCAGGIALVLPSSIRSLCYTVTTFPLHLY